MPTFSELAPEIAAFLAASRTATLATSDVEGIPHAVSLRFASDARWRLYWVSSEGSLHSRNLAHRPQAAMTIYGHEDEPAQIHGLQIRGRAQRVADADHRAALHVYAARHRAIAADPALAALIARQSFYCFEPTWMQWIDNRRGFGFKVEHDLL
ncbi:MAG: pyridoxamine 5'-phosphate oxidase family protein [Phycisphaeraceae bacterium]